MSIESELKPAETRARPDLRLIVNHNFREPNDFKAFSLDNAASRFAHSLKIEYEKRGRDRSKGILVETMPGDDVIIAATEVLFGMGYYANITPASAHGTDGYAWLTRREADFESW